MNSSTFTTVVQECEVVEMIQLLASPASSQFAPVYQSNLARTIGVLQQLQVLCDAQGDASLADVIEVVRDMQHDFGENTRLEHVIQHLVGQFLTEQLTARRQQRAHVMEVLQ